MEEKTLRIYKEKKEYILEEIHGSNVVSKKNCGKEKGLLEALTPYKKIVNEYNLEIQQGEDVMDKVMKYLF